MVTRREANTDQGAGPASGRGIRRLIRQTYTRLILPCGGKALDPYPRSTRPRTAIGFAGSDTENELKLCCEPPPSEP